jgi:hypothetical protein
VELLTGNRAWLLFLRFLLFCGHFEPYFVYLAEKAGFLCAQLGGVLRSRRGCSIPASVGTSSGVYIY